jgi:hypothetical protein
MGSPGTAKYGPLPNSGQTFVVSELLRDG